MAPKTWAPGGKAGLGFEVGVERIVPANSEPEVLLGEREVSEVLKKNKIVSQITGWEAFVLEAGCEMARRRHFEGSPN